MTAFVKSVEYVEITLTDDTATSANLTKSQTIADCVPFFTINLDSTAGDDTTERYVDVYFEAGPKVTAIRDGSTGTIIVGIFVVEFDTGVVSVQQGTFSVPDTSATEAITSVTTTKAFCIIAYRYDGTSDDWNEPQTTVKFNSSTQLGFERAVATATVNGHYYVVSTTGSEFSVQHVTMSPAGTDETDTDTITAVTLADTFVYSTQKTNEAADDLKEIFVVDLQDTTTVRARRAFDSFGGSPGNATALNTIETQIVSAGASEFSVQRDECDWGDSLTKAVTITAIDQAKAIVIAGGDMGVMSANSTSGVDVPGAYAILDFTSDSEVTGTRATNTSVDGTTMFEVVEFVLAGVGQQVAIGTASETDSGLAVVLEKRRMAAVVLETDAALVAAPERLVPFSLASETDTALVLGLARGAAVSVASETDVPLALGKAKVKSVGFPTEADLALGIAAVRLVPILVAAETDLALALTVSRAVPVGLADETDASLLLGAARGLGVLAAAETDAALQVRPVRVVSAGLVSELDAALALAILKTVVVGLASETDAALAVSTGLGIPVGTAGETDVALALGRLKTMALGIAAEADAALLIQPQRNYILPLVLETDAALAISYARAALVGLATELDAALAVTVAGAPPSANDMLLYRRRRRW